MRGTWRASVALGCAVLVSTCAPTAQANGRFPGARQVVVSPKADGTVLLRTTFGQMLTRDGGQSFRWLCEEIIGYGGTQDPAVGITEAGTPSRGPKRLGPVCGGLPWRRRRSWESAAVDERP